MDAGPAPSMGDLQDAGFLAEKAADRIAGNIYSRGEFNDGVKLLGKDAQGYEVFGRHNCLTNTPRFLGPGWRGTFDLVPSGTTALAPKIRIHLLRAAAKFP